MGYKPVKLLGNVKNTDIFTGFLFIKIKIFKSLGFATNLPAFYGEMVHGYIL
jgi:hypothetical protein